MSTNFYCLMKTLAVRASALESLHFQQLELLKSRRNSTKTAQFHKK